MGSDHQGDNENHDDDDDDTDNDDDDDVDALMMMTTIKTSKRVAQQPCNMLIKR